MSAAIYDFDAIRQRLNQVGVKTITGEKFPEGGYDCAAKDGKPPSECACWNAGPNGNHLPCSGARNRKS